MLTPAMSATLLVVKPAQPWADKMRAAASIMASTIAFERDWRGSLRIGRLAFSMRVDKGSAPAKNVNKLLAFFETATEVP